MASLNMSLPQALKDYVEDQVSGGSYSTPGEYLRELLRRDQQQRAQARLDTLLLEAIESGDPIRVTPAHIKTCAASL